VQARTLYGVIAVLVAAMLVVSSAGVYYYYQDQQASTLNQQHTAELDAALASYKALSGSFNESLGGYNETLSLLMGAVAGLNTSTPAYHEASLALASLWSTYQSLAKARGSGTLAYEVHMLVDFGNGTRIWYNDTNVQPGWNGYVATLVFLDGRVQATWYPQFGEHFVTGIDGVADTSADFWFLLTYNKTSSWQVAQVGADDIPMLNGTNFAWVYCPENASYLPACPLP
jgi:hypothetical protein